jgi:hypothetical protein
MLTKGDMLNRMEILFPDQPLLSDLRRSYIDQDWSSIFRLVAHYYGIEVDDLRNAIVEEELHSLFRVMEMVSDDSFDDLRKAMLEKNLYALFRIVNSNSGFTETEGTVLLKKAVADKNLRATLKLVEFLLDRMDHQIQDNYQIGDLRKLLLDDNVWSMYRCIGAIKETQILTAAVKSMHVDGVRFDSDSLSQGQLASKMWLIHELQDIDADLGTVFLCAGWYGILATLMFENDLKIDKIRSFDLDPDVVSIAEKFNLPWVKAEWKFKPATLDIHDLEYENFEYEVTRSDGSATKLNDTADTVINTSCEHINDFDEWYAKIPGGTMVVLQSNDYAEIKEHVNTSDNLYEFAVQTPMSEVYYSGEMAFDKYTRFMRIGIK